MATENEYLVMKKGELFYMGDIIKLFGAVAGLVLICGGVAVGIYVLLYPICFELRFKENYGKNGILYVWTAVQLICFAGAFLDMGSKSPGELAEAWSITIIVFTIAVFRNYKRMKRLGMTQKVCWLAAFAQFTAPFGVAFILLLISSLFSMSSQKKNDDKKI